MASSCTLELKVIPNAPRNEIVGWFSAAKGGTPGQYGDALKVKVHAPALEGRANDELLDFLAAELGVPRRSLALLRGEKSRQKVVRVDGLDATTVRTRFANK